MAPVWRPALCLALACARVRDITITVNRASLTVTYEDTADPAATAAHVCRLFGLGADAACKRYVLGALDDQRQDRALGFVTPA